jgi:inner membrane protein
MQKSLAKKTLAISILALVLWIPLANIHGLVRERQARQEQVVQEIGQSYAGPQRLVGPVLVLPYTEDYREQEKSGEGGALRQVSRRVEGALYLFPQQLDLDGEVSTEVKRRGLFSALVLELQGTLSGRFDIPERLPLKPRAADSQVSFGEPYLLLGIADPRGLTGSPRLQWDGQPLGLIRAAALPGAPAGIRAELPDVRPGTAKSAGFSLRLGLRGTGALAFVPIGDDTRARLRSAWPHPSFAGRHLPSPQQQAVGADGFRAEWHVTSLASQAQQQFLDGVAKRQCQAGGCLEALEVRFIEPVNVYTQSERAVKYGFLFIGLTFAAFFLFEVLKALPIHPAQYLLVGLALAIFFLLLLAAAEHLPFWAAYLVSAVACVGLQGVYLSSVLRSTRRGAAFAGLLALLYAALYGLLASEDNALVLGSALLFVLLAGVMWLTRDLDWYRLPGLGVQPPAAPAPAPGQAE